tara:strand:+ start:1183 stop:1350 length:168 start_codon:yes stop_codon:yes gene_type:complete
MMKKKNKEFAEDANLYDMIKILEQRIIDLESFNQILTRKIGELDSEVNNLQTNEN